MNRLDSELVTTSLRSAGHEIITSREAADVVLYNTCSVRQHAEQKVFSRLGRDAILKADGDKLIVGVLGCMAQRLGEKLASQFHAVDVICAPGQLHKLPEMIAEAAGGDRQISLDPETGHSPDTAAQAKMDEMDLSRDADLGPSTSQAFVRVMRGCDIFCTYCIVPHVRGSQRSRRPDHIAREVKQLVDAGKTEITLIGQIVNCYRWESGDLTVTFADLLKRISPIPGLRRLRFVTSHPLDFSDDILYAMRDLDNVCQYIHCPAQSGSDAVLKRMNRRYTAGEYDSLIQRARTILPDVVLAGDFIVGFPGETEADHQASADLIRRSGYKNSFIFKYSPRPGTASAKNLTDDVPEEVKRRRNSELLAVQEEVSLAHHKQFLNKSVEVLVTGASVKALKLASKSAEVSPQLQGRTRGDHIVIFDGPAELIGQYVDINATRIAPLTLFGVLCQTQSHLNA